MAICEGFINPLNLQCLLVNTLAGNPTIWLFLMLIVILGMAAYFRMSNVVALSSIAMFVVVMANYVDRGVYAFVIIIASLLTFYSIAKLITR